jgi:hypothetical protein
MLFKSNFLALLSFRIEDAVLLYASATAHFSFCFNYMESEDN